VTEAKSEVEAMTASAATAKTNWRKRRRRPPGVPGIPGRSFMRTPCGFSAASVIGGASTGCTAGRLENISLFPFSPVSDLLSFLFDWWRKRTQGTNWNNSV
jgi:hypothetical protein